MAFVQRLGIWLAQQSLWWVWQSSCLRRAPHRTALFKIFVGVPLTFILNSWQISSGRVVRCGVDFQVVFIIIFELWVLLLQAGVFRNFS